MNLPQDDAIHILAWTSCAVPDASLTPLFSAPGTRFCGTSAELMLRLKAVQRCDLVLLAGNEDPETLDVLARAASKLRPDIQVMTLVAGGSSDRTSLSPEHCFHARPPQRCDH